MSSTLTQNHFEIFSLPEHYQLDRDDLDVRYRDLQRAVHPDRFANASDQERRLSVQRAAQINEAFTTLKDPLKRGQYLLVLRGHTIEDEQQTHQDPEFLMQQIELREQLAEVRTQDDPMQVLDGLSVEIRKQYHELENGLGKALDAGDDIEQAILLAQRMQFFTRLNSEVHELEADLEDELY